jgi:release factor glutamine methyltransferase
MKAFGINLFALPGVHRPCSDTWLLADAMKQYELEGKAVTDLCAGSGALAIAAKRAGAQRVLAVDVSRRATLATRLNAARNGCFVEARRGDMFEALGSDERFDLVVCNPPYVPAETDALPRHRSTTPLDGGRDGRAIVDRVCREVSHHLQPGGSVLLVHSSVCGVEETCARLRAHGLDGTVIARKRGPLGPVLRKRARMLRARGLLGSADEEDLVVVRGRARGQTSGL